MSIPLYLTFSRHLSITELKWRINTLCCQQLLFFITDFRLSNFRKRMRHQKIKTRVMKIIQFNKAIIAAQISDKQLIRQLREENFDLAMGEMFDYCMFGIFELLNIPARILTSAVPFSEGHAILFGVPAPTSYVPSKLLR